MCEMIRTAETVNPFSGERCTQHVIGLLAVLSVALPLVAFMRCTIFRIVWWIA